MGTAADRRVSLVTGGTGGIGRAVALQLAAGGDRVLFVGRDEQRGREVMAALRQRQPDAKHVFLCADLSLLSDTARVADDVTRHTGRLDAAVFCAGILSTVPEWTSEGLERNFVLNYLTRYLLIRRLLPSLIRAPSGRVVLVSNAGVYNDTLDFDDLQQRNGKPGMAVSGRTQFANDLLATELAERLRGSRVEVTCVFPGLTRTGVFRNARGLPWIRHLALPRRERMHVHRDGGRDEVATALDRLIQFNAPPIRRELLDGRAARVLGDPDSLANGQRIYLGPRPLG